MNSSFVVENTLRLRYKTSQSELLHGLVTGCCENQIKVKVKVTFTSEQAMKTQTGSRGIAVLFLYSRRWMGWVVNCTPRPLYPRERYLVLIVQEAG